MSVLKEAALAAVRKYVESLGDYPLRRAGIAIMRDFILDLERECERIRVLDFPLWFMENNEGYNHSGFLIIRDDVDPDFIKMISRDFLVDLSHAAVIMGEDYLHPEYRCFHREPVLIGNDASPVRRYLYAPILAGTGSMNTMLRNTLIATLGAGWNAPRDPEGNLISRRK